MAFPTALNRVGDPVLPGGIVPFPRGFDFDRDGRLFLDSGIGPNGEGDDTMAFALSGVIQRHWAVRHPELSPLDPAIAPNDNVVVSSEHPFGMPDAVTTIRGYDAIDGHVVRILSPGDAISKTARPALRPRRHALLRAREEVVDFEFVSGACLGAIVQFSPLNGLGDRALHSHSRIANGPKEMSHR